MPDGNEKLSQESLYKSNRLRYCLPTRQGRPRTKAYIT